MQRMNVCSNQTTTCSHTRLPTCLHSQHGRVRPFKGSVVTCASNDRNRQQATTAADDTSTSRLQKACTGIAIAAATSVLGLSLAAQAITTEQLLFLEAWRAVDRAYVDKNFNDQSWFRVREAFLKIEPMGNRGQTYAAVRKLLATLDDPFTRFLEPERLAALRRGTQGAVTGVGVEVTFNDTGAQSEPVVVAPAPGGPAEKGGVRAGDKIAAVDGRPTAGLSLYEVSDLLQGPQGSSVTLSLRPAGAAPGAAVREVVLERQKVTINPVDSRLCSGVASAALPPGAKGSKLGYIRLATFNSNTVSAVREAIDSLDQQGVDGFVLDMRNNSGGLFPAGVSVAKMWMDRGDIVLIADSQGVRDIYSANTTALDTSTPLVVLVNKGTASAAEVLAGALKDNHRATIAGTSTFGKGLIQTVVDLSDGSGVAITVARYQTPAGVDINKIGIKPDVQLDAEALPAPGGDGVCRLLASAEAPSLFAAK